MDPDPVWIRNDLFLLDQDPYRECGSGSGSRSKKTDQNYQINMNSSLFLQTQENPDPENTGWCKELAASLPCTRSRACCRLSLEPTLYEE